MSERGSLRDRFWAKVSIGEPSECWRWNGSLGSNGYGQINISGRPLKAPRVAWFLTFGFWPGGGLCVCHRCDNRACVNPSHLFLGTVKDNTEDMLRKGRGSAPPVLRGEKGTAAKLTELQVARIRERLREGSTTKELGRAYGVSQAAIWWIKVGRNWAHSAGPDAAGPSRRREA